MRTSAEATHVMSADASAPDKAACHAIEPSPRSHNPFICCDYGNSSGTSQLNSELPRLFRSPGALASVPFTDYHRCPQPLPEQRQHTHRKSNCTMDTNVARKSNAPDFATAYYFL